MVANQLKASTRFFFKKRTFDKAFYLTALKEEGCMLPEE